MNRREFLQYAHVSTAGLWLGANIGCASLFSGSRQEAASLDGAWTSQLDQGDVGLSEQWFTRSLSDRLALPGSLQEQGFGNDIDTTTEWTGTLYDQQWYTRPQYQPYTKPGNIKLPFWLQPEKHYVGVAWYDRAVDVPEDWSGRRVVLFLERPHWATQVWVDGQRAGFNDSLSTPHVYDLGTALAPGTHRLSIRIDNRLHIPVGLDAHSVSDNTQTNWNGIVGRIELLTTSPVWLEDVQVYPDVDRKAARIRARIGNSTGQPGSGSLSAGSSQVSASWNADGGTAELDVRLDEAAELWDEFNPALQQVTVRLTGEGADDQRTTTFGLRKIGTDGRQFTLNGRKMYVRGTLECCIFPLTGYPPTDVESWERIIRICQDHGLNTIRFHSWCPPEAAFLAADTLGMYLQPEAAVWARETTIGTGSPLDQWIYHETDRILAAYGNHPSFLFMTHGNEPGGGTPQEDYLNAWLTHYKSQDPRRLWAGASNQCVVAEDQYHLDTQYGGHPVRGDLGWRGQDYRVGVDASPVPLVSHEIGQFCVFPNFDSIPKYTGSLKANNLEVFRESLEANGLIGYAEDFLEASGKLQVLCYKEEIEAALRTRGMGGFHLLDLHDFPGQCTALIGVLDPFWDSKGYVTADAYRRFCGRTVPLVRIGHYEWTTAQTFAADVEIAHFGQAPIDPAQPVWELQDVDGRTVASGRLRARSIPIDNGIPLGRIEAALHGLAAPAAYRLVVRLDGTDVENDWRIWVYPAQVDTSVPEGILVAASLDRAARAHLDRGGRVLFMPPTADFGPRHPVGAFAPIFWNTVMWRALGRTPEVQTLGLLNRTNHPALAGFPTEFHTDWQWADIAQHSRACVLDDLPREIRPIVQYIDDWNMNRFMGMIFEARAGNGSLLFCSADLRTNIEQRPASRQLYRSLLDYMAGGRFRPEAAVDVDALSRLPT